MKKISSFIRLFFLTFFLVTATNSRAQKKMTVVSSRQNNYCNSTCTLLNSPELDNNPNAVIMITNVKQITHPVAVYYIKTKRDTSQWSIVNLDNSSMIPGTQFNVEYYTRPDDNHFVHVVNSDNLIVNKDNVKKKGSYIDHVGLNNNPGAQFELLQNLAPGVRGGIGNRYEIQMQYDSVAARWYMFNTNDRTLEYSTAYNIIITNQQNTIAGPAKGKDIVQKILPKAYDFSNVHVCLDKVPSKNLPPKTAVNHVPVIPKIKPNGELETISTITQPLTGVTNFMWSPGDTITVGFYANETTPLVIGKAGIYIKAWEAIANVKFQFVSDVTTAKIKVGFILNNSSWSWIGRDVLDNPTGERTVNFGWFTNKTSEAEFRRVILHEFGHVLGFIHEHQAPSAGIPWDKEKVYAFFGGPPNSWDSAKINHNIFETYSTTETNSSTYDRLSIMHYFFPPELVTDGSVFTNNTNFSATDMQFAKLVYPYPAKSPSVTGILHTGDDCDEIEFSVDYGVVDKSIIEFSIEPGRDANNNLITWWKKIAVPVVGNGEIGLEMQDGHYAIKQVAAAIIDRNKGISFGKAKGLGVHTGLNFTWNVWPAIIGGCRVKLVWRRDKC